MNTSRARAIRYVTRLVQEYEGLVRMGRDYSGSLRGKDGRPGHIAELRAEIGTMMAAGLEGERIARTWDFLVGDIA